VIRSRARGVLMALAALLASGCSSPPSVVLIIIDTLRADRLGSYGYAPDVSPELDLLAREGVRFESVLAQCSWTRPSVASLLTSQHPRTLGIYDDSAVQILPSRFETLAEVLGAEGYTTVGLTANPNLNRLFNFEQGFDHYVDSTVVWHPDLYGESTAGVTRHDVRNPFPSARELFLRAEEILDEVNGGPVYLQINLMEVHEGADLVRAGQLGEHAAGLEHLEPPERGYVMGVREVSARLGEFLTGLRARSGFDDALVVITSDHGEGLLDHPAVADSRGHGNLLYASQVKVPLIFHQPGALEPSTVSTPARLIDLVPTLLEHLGIAVPQDAAGLSFARALGGGEAPVGLPRFYVTETQFREHDKLAADGEKWAFFLHRADASAGTGRAELQLVGPPENGQKTNRIRDQPRVAQFMRRFLDTWDRVETMSEPEERAEPAPQRDADQLRSLGYLD